MTICLIAGSLAGCLLVSAMRRQARILHPDMGGDAEQFREMFAAYERLLRYYPKEG